MRTYTCDAGLSPTSITARPGVMPFFLSAAISVPSPARIAAPIAFPSISLAGNADRPCYADHYDLDLPRVLQLALDLARDFVGEPRGGGIVHRFGGHHHAHFPARLNRKHPVHALELGGELLEIAEAFDIGFERLAPGARAGARNRIARLPDDADRRFVGGAT